jgi:cold shock CspA family protein
MPEGTEMKGYGHIKYYNPERRFGFIASPGNEYFFHVSHFAGEPQLGLSVQFEVAPAIKEGKAPMAIKVKPVEADPYTLVSLALTVDATKAGQ